MLQGIGILIGGLAMTLAGLFCMYYGFVHVCSKILDEHWH